MIEGPRLSGAWCIWSSEQYMVGSLDLEDELAYHLDVALTAVVDSGPNGIGGR